MSYQYSNGCNRMLGWTAVSTNDFEDLRSVDVTGFSSETIGTNPTLGQLYVSNSVGGSALAPSVFGADFTLASCLLPFGTSSLVAAIGDVAGNVGYATSTVVLQIVTNGSYSYSQAGCITNIAYSGPGVGETISLSWNGLYQLTGLSTNGTPAEQNAYDPLGRRAWCSVRSPSGSMETNYFVYDGPHVVADLDGTGGLVRTYTYGPGIDNLLAMTVHTGATARTYFYLTDHLGSVHALADETGVIVESYCYDAWGRVLGVYDTFNVPLSTSHSSLGNRFLWQGREYSWSTGLYYFRARWYDPITGRWLSNDPIGISGGLNQYVFCANNPVNSRDPFGLCAEGGDGWYGWWDRLEAWSRNNVNESFNATSGLWWPLQGTLLTAMELGHGLAAFPSAIGHLGEGSGTFAGDPSWETSPGLFMDISTVASVGAITAIGLPSARTPFGRTPAGRAYTQHYGTETGPVRNIPGSVIDNTINVGQSSRVAGGKTVYYEPANDVTVVVGRRGIMSARRGAP